MALSGSVSTSKYDGRYYTVSWTATQSTADNTSTIKWTLSADGKEGAWYAERTLKVVLAGQTVFSKTSRVEREDGKIDSGSVTLTHSSVGEKKFTIKIEGAVYGSSVNVTGEKEFTLDTIERYAKITSFSVSARDETSVKFNWSADEPCDYAKYSTDNGSTWKDLPTNNVISGLTANTSYNFKLQLRRADSKQWTTSSAVKQSTYDYPHCTESPNFILGNAVTLKFYNPLSRAFKFYIIGNGTEIDVEYSCSSTTYTGVNNPASSVPYLYNTISNAKSGKYKVKVVYDTSIKTRDNGNTYTIKESACYPTFTTFTYKDANATVTNITGNNQVLVKGLSKLTVDINATNKMIALNGATPKNYVATIDALNAPIDYSTSAITKEIGVISTVAPPSETKRLTVTAYDSRTLPKAVYKNITVYDYNLPKINVSAKRLNNFEAQTTIKISGEYSRLTINGADKNTISKVEYRYRETGTNAWTSWTPLTTTLSGGKITCSDEIKSLDNTKAFEIQVRAYDKFTSADTTLLDKSTVTAKVDVGQAVFFVSSNKRTAFLNNKEITTRENVRELVNYTRLETNTDLNTIVNVGTYRSIQSTDTATMTNVPSGFNGGFTMYVYTWTSNASNTDYRRQEIIYASNTYIRTTTDGGKTWTAWKRMVSSTEIANIVFPVNSVYVTATNTNPATLLGMGTWTAIDNANGKYFWKRTS